MPGVYHLFFFALSIGSAPVEKNLRNLAEK